MEGDESDEEEEEEDVEVVYDQRWEVSIPNAVIVEVCMKLNKDIVFFQKKKKIENNYGRCNKKCALALYIYIIFLESCGENRS